MNFNDIIRNIFFAILTINFATPLIKKGYDNFKMNSQPHIKVGLLKIKGPISEANYYVKRIAYLFKEPTPDAILMIVDSPGGAAGSSQVIANEIKHYKETHQIPVVCFVENICASGGYYIASSSDYIISSPAAYIGSIGAYISLPYFKEFIEQFKLKYNFIKAGKYKTAGNPFTEITQEQENMFQDVTNNVYQQFVNDVMKARTDLDKDTSKWAEGKIFTGEQALNLKLIDEIGSISNAINTIKKLCKVEDDYKIIWKIYPIKTNFIESLLNPNNEDDNPGYLKSNISNKIINSFIDAIEKRYNLNNNDNNINLNL